METFPRQKALTRSFRLGVPRSFHVTSDQVLFIRGEDGRSPAGDLWIMRAADDWRESKLVSSTQLFENSAELDPAEAARRERLREVTTGITDYSVDEPAQRAAFTVNGELFWVNTGTAELHHIATEHSVIDPRIAPDGSHIAFVMRNSVWLTELPESPSPPTATPSVISGAESDAPRSSGRMWVVAEPESDTVA